MYKHTYLIFRGRRKPTFETAQAKHGRSQSKCLESNDKKQAAQEEMQVEATPSKKVAQRTPNSTEKEPKGRRSKAKATPTPTKAKKLDATATPEPCAKAKPKATPSKRRKKAAVDEATTDEEAQSRKPAKPTEVAPTEVTPKRAKTGKGKGWAPSIENSTGRGRAKQQQPTKPAEPADKPAQPADKPADKPAEPEHKPEDDAKPLAAGLPLPAHLDGKTGQAMHEQMDALANKKTMGRVHAVF